MGPLGIQMTFDDLEDGNNLSGKIFELYEKTPHREFKAHVQFIMAEDVCMAEDMALEIDPEYWKTKSVRPVTVDYAWETFTQLYYSYSIAKSVLGLNDVIEDEVF